MSNWMFPANFLNPFQQILMLTKHVLVIYLRIILMFKCFEDCLTILIVLIKFVQLLKTEYQIVEIAFNCWMVMLHCWSHFNCWKVLILCLNQKLKCYRSSIVEKFWRFVESNLSLVEMNYANVETWKFCWKQMKIVQKQLRKGVYVFFI